MALFDGGYWRELERLKALARRVYAPRRIHRLKRLGSGLEVADRRPYAPGDEIRYLDWRYYARSEHLVTRAFEEDRELLYLFVLDGSASMRAKWDAARRLFHACVYLALCARDGVVAGVASEGRWRFLGRWRGEASGRRAAEAVAGARVGGSTDLTSSIEAALAASANLQAVVMLTDAWDERWSAALGLLRQAALPSVVVLLHGRSDRAVLWRGEMRLLDSEDGSGLRITVDEALARAYEAERLRWLSEIETACRLNVAEPVVADAERPFGLAVESLLRLGYFLP